MLRVTSAGLLGAALGALLLAIVAVAAYPRLIEHGAAGGLVALVQGLGIAALAAALLLPIAAIVFRLAR